MTDDLLVSALGAQAAAFEHDACKTHGPVTVRGRVQGADVVYGCELTFAGGGKVRYGWQRVKRVDGSDQLQPFEEWV